MATMLKRIPTGSALTDDQPVLRRVGNSIVPLNLAERPPVASLR
jgi:hypothetical protein